MERTTQRRIFVVGSPRSGTTLLQAMFAAHPQVVSFPETHYFRRVWGRMYDRRTLGLVSPRAAAATLDRLMELTGSTRRRPPVPRRWPFFHAYARAFVKVVDGACVDAGCTAWVEKTPTHLHVRSLIRRAVPRARFVHIVRDGRDVVASMYERCLDDPARWLPPAVRGDRDAALAEQGHGRLLDALAQQWNDEMAMTLAGGCEGDTVVSFARLQDDPAATLAKPCTHVGLEFDERMLRYWEVADAVVGHRSAFTHMHGVYRPLRVEVAGERFAATLDPSQQQRVLARLRAAGRVDELLP